MDLRFRPSGARAKIIHQRMNRELAASIKHLIEQVGVNDARLQTKLNLLIDLLQAGKKLHPGLFASYYRVVVDILSGTQDQHQIFENLLRFAQVIDCFEIIDLSVQSLGNDAIVHLYVGALDTDERLSFEFLPPELNESTQSRASITRALELMQKVAPDVFAEFEQLIHQVILASGSRSPTAAQFDGASSYMLWGALALSVNQSKTDLEMLQALAHEAAHSVLFGLTIDELLVNNPEDDLFLSPLRDDARPMDGVYHATFVSARMYYAINSAKDSGILSKTELAECDQLLIRSRQAFLDGLGVVESKGDLSHTGKSIMDDTKNYMASA
ncbi:MAG: HEXXH motif-containing putative peptide modification protein [Porticoccaceae bacterium]